MDATPQITQVIQSLRVGDLVGHRQRPTRQYEVLMVDGQRLLTARFITLGNVVGLF